MGTCAYPFWGVLDLMVAEARACLQALIFTANLGLTDICVEGDALVVINKLRNETVDRSVVGDIIKESKRILGGFRSHTIKFVPRTANGVTHEMAKWGKGCEFPSYWVEEAPPEVEAIVVRKQEV